MLVADFTFGQALLTVLEIFLFAAYLMVLFTIIGDLFRDHQLSGWAKAAWVVFLIFVPFLAALIYLIARGDGMRERALHEQQQAQQQLDSYIRQTSGGGGSAADELAKLAKLHDDKKLSDEEFARAKAKIVA
jgi:Phospholipase_D-nuclease N-terminal